MPYEFKLPDLKEAVLQDAEEKDWKSFVEKHANHPIIRRALKEGLYQDSAQALSGMQKTILSPVYPKLIARRLLTVIPTTNEAERFYVGKRGYTMRSRGDIADIGAKPTTPVDISANIVNVAGQSWDETFREDVKWDIMAFETENLRNEFIRTENTDVITLFNAIANGDLAGGAEATITDGAPTWAEILNAIDNFAGTDDYPDVCALNTVEFIHLFNLDQFINGLYSGISSGSPSAYIVHHALLNIDFLGCSQVTKTLFANSRRAGVFLLRTDAQIKPWTNNERGTYGVNARERYGLGIIDPGSVVRGDH